MKTDFINSLVKYLIEKEYFNLITAENEPMDFGSRPASLIKEFQGTSVLLEIIDADRYDNDRIMQTMESGAHMLENISGNNATVFKLFLFDNEPEEEKIRIIKEGQKDLTVEKRFLKCISINISGRNVEKHFSVPAFDANIIRAVKRFFSKKLDAVETSAEDIENLIEQRQKDFEIHLSAKKPYITYGLIAANFAVWLLINLVAMKAGTSYNELLSTFGAKVNTLIMGGQYWRFLSPMFLHSDIVHLGVNCYSLFIVGSQVERIFGHGKFTAIYFISGFLGCVASFAFSMNASVGASGAIFGLLGAMLYFAIKRPSLLKSSFGANLMTTLVINLVYGLMNKQIDNHAHVGGLIGGFLTTGAVYTVQNESGEEARKNKLSRLIAFLLVIIVSAGGLFYGFNNQLNRLALKVETLQNHISSNNWSEAEKVSEDILGQKLTDRDTEVSVLWNLVRSEVLQSKYDEGIEHANQLVELSPVDGHYLLGVIYFDSAQYDKAREELLASKKAGSSYTESIDKLISEIENKSNSENK